ncbi:hypothetical protein M427DRAFT_48094 [Gonapodya prolifera JEL478]|uniref:Uncharacterized protein n=1 Tax=Gonapodya prolifera (strain JEL478) TaxID=1344416 RepID=A0A139A165_GONPJ|nr:hypothetical protein M427DRAFT_48094 [Gonapodya prolifera JEL478]|eukprot:KXS10516.1 hypothetical protein M427DRAFT_48094 [Gonapodya prolifera JEL478]
MMETGPLLIELTSLSCLPLITSAQERKSLTDNDNRGRGRDGPALWKREVSPPLGEWQPPPHGGAPHGRALDAISGDVLTYFRARGYEFTQRAGDMLRDGDHHAQTSVTVQGTPTSTHWRQHPPVKIVGSCSVLPGVRTRYLFVFRNSPTGLHAPAFPQLSR